jgi:hypothetical protein
MAASMKEYLHLNPEGTWEEAKRYADKAWPAWEDDALDRLLTGETTWDDPEEPTWDGPEEETVGEDDPDGVADREAEAMTPEVVRRIMEGEGEDSSSVVGLLPGGRFAARANGKSGGEPTTDREPPAEPGVYLVRHGHTASNKSVQDSKDRIRGWLDIPLDAEGERQAAELEPVGEHRRLDKVYSSDLKRARTTAEALAKGAGVIPEFTTRLRPWNLGVIQGQDAAEAAPFIKAHVNTPEVPVEKGESFGD